MHLIAKKQSFYRGIILKLLESNYIPEELVPENQKLYLISLLKSKLFDLYDEMFINWLKKCEYEKVDPTKLYY
jgi:hypothetical protein